MARFIEGTIRQDQAEADQKYAASTKSLGLGTPPETLVTARACARTVDYLLAHQYPEGYWWAELESNATITAEYLMLFHLLGRVDRDRERKMVRYLCNRQAPNGSWELYHGDGGDLSTTVEAYLALKLAGESVSQGPLRKAGKFILSRGGVECSRVFTKIWLALFSQYDYEKIPCMPVEMILLPTWSPFNIYEFSSWARSTVVPLTVALAYRPSIRLPAEQGIKELVGKSNGRSQAVPSPAHKLFILTDRLLKLYDQHPLKSVRQKAIAASERWILERQEESGDWGGIQPPMIYGVLALHLLGYGFDHPVLARGLKALESFCIEDEETLSLQACVSPVWDTGLNCLALLDAGLPAEHPAIQRAGSWLVQNQICRGGDWQVKNSCPPGGWAFEFANNQYPDVDDTAVVLMALKRMRGGPELASSIPRGLRWCLSMQSSCGGWAAFDRNNTKVILNKIPFADQEAMVDYPTADVTARVLEAMGVLGYGPDHPRARDAIAFLKQLQEPDGSWWGRWGVNYVYGTWSVLRGLTKIGEELGQPYIQRAADWLERHQNGNGGWGETCASYQCPELRGRGPSTASQTAWALMGLIAAGRARSDAVRRGVEYLVDTQLPDGTWDEPHSTGTGFPKHFYVHYNNYRNCFPLMALGQYLSAVSG